MALASGDYRFTPDGGLEDTKDDPAPEITREPDLLHGYLEIDHARGVIYFHPEEGPLMGNTLLRICRLPAPIPKGKVLDITHMFGCDWR